jgi:hypothetical protein
MKALLVEWRYSSTLSLISALGGGGWLTPGPCRLTPGNNPVPIVQEAGCAPGPVWTGVENIASTGSRAPAVQLEYYNIILKIS